MIREIKYRAYHKTLKIELDVLVIDWLNELVDLEGGLIEQEFKNVELLQYTGLKDKNGVEIYEGDIIRFTNSIDEIDKEVGKVTWEQSECNFVAQYRTANYVTQEENGTTITIYLISNETYRDCVEYEVIGNVYQNPELLGWKN